MRNERGAQPRNASGARVQRQRKFGRQGWSIAEKPPLGEGGVVLEWRMVPGACGAHRGHMTHMNIESHRPDAYRAIGRAERSTAADGGHHTRHSTRLAACIPRSAR